MEDVIKATRKKIIVCCDGTWQSAVTGKPGLPSNVTRLARTIAKAGKGDDGKPWQQIVFYDAGIGTGSVSKVEANVQGATGEGLVTNVLEAYNFIVNNYSPGDKIYCFGFSRGAFTARAIAGMVTDLGVIKPQFMKYFPSLFTAYQKNLDKRTFRKTKEYFEWYNGKVQFVPLSKKDEPVTLNWYDSGVSHMESEPVEYENSRMVELVGVFDTVGSLGLGDTWFHGHASSRRPFEWLNVKWSPYIKHAFHAMALDERREPFLPSLFYIPEFDGDKGEKALQKENEAMAKDEVNWPELKEHRQKMDQEYRDQWKKHEKELAEEKCPRNIDLVQVWFTGVHINVGGGNDDTGPDFEGLANITFAWMVEQCRPYLAFETFTNDTIANYLQRVAAQRSESTSQKSEQPGVVENLGNKFGKLIYGESKEKMVRATKVRGVPPPVMYHPAHWGVFRSQDSYGLIFRLIHGPQNRSPGESDDRSTETHLPLRELGYTNEYMHPSIKYRIDMSQANKDKDKEDMYKSEPLEKFKYTQQKNGVYSWYKKGENGEIWIPEWPILAALEPSDSIKEELQNSEMVLIDKGEDKNEVRKFLSDRATAWKKVHPDWN